MGNRTEKTSCTCQNCGKVFSAPPSQRRKFCSKACVNAWHKQSKTNTGRFLGKGREYELVHIRIKRPIGLKKGFEPELRTVYLAEKYTDYTLGYVIEVNGHRINIRLNECVEVTE